MYELKVTSLVTKSLEDKQDFVKRIEFDYVYTEQVGDESITVSTSSFVLLDQLGNDYTPFDSLSEEQVKQWIVQKADMQLLEQTLDSKMNVFRNIETAPIEEKRSLPWSNK